MLTARHTIERTWRYKLLGHTTLFIANLFSSPCDFWKCCARLSDIHLAMVNSNNIVWKFSFSFYIHV